MQVFSPSFIEVALPAGHRFPMGKYAHLTEFLKQKGWRVQRAPRAQMEDLQRIHSEHYLQSWLYGTLSAKEERILGFPYSAAMLERSLHSVGGTLAAMVQAFELGYGVNLAGGTHHAFADRGEGFCVFNDLAVCARKALDTNLARRILIIDLDVHQGNGTAKIFETNPSVFTFSMHGERNYPFKKECSDLDIGLADGTTDQVYLEILGQHLPEVFNNFDPDLVLFQAGVDVLANDRFGRMALSQEGVVARDQIVYETCKHKQIPVVYTMGGGYQQDVSLIVAAHAASLEALRSTFS